MHIDAMFITAPTNLTYFSGFIPLDVTEREASIIITPTKQYIFTSALYADEVKAYVTDYQLIEVRAEYPLHKGLADLCTKEHIRTIGFEERNLTFAEYQKVLCKTVTFTACDINHLRIIKDTQEIAAISKACAIGDQAFTTILDQITLGMTEKDLAWMLEDVMRKQHTSPSFPTIAGFGKNAAVPHHVTADTQLEKNQFILMDFGVKANGYCSDMTRTIFFGTPTIVQEKRYLAVYDSQQAAIDYVQKTARLKKPIQASRVDKRSRDSLIKKGFPSYPHSLGHGIGLQVHEPPSLSPYSEDVLTEGMVFSIEPGIYYPGYEGIRIEDLGILKNDSLSLLTTSPRTLIIL